MTPGGMPLVGQAPAEQRIVLFDFDGVLIHGDAFGMFMRDRFRRAPLRKLLAVLASPWLLSTLVFSPKRSIRSLVHLGLLGVGQRRYTAAAEAFADTLVQRPGRFVRDGVQTLRRHQAAGDRVIVVTGCERVLVSAILRKLGLTDLAVLASELAPGWTGMRVRRHNVGRRKVQSLAAEAITACQRAYGDSAYDIAMLGLAEEPVLVNGTPRLCKKVEAALGRSVTRVAWY